MHTIVKSTSKRFFKPPPHTHFASSVCSPLWSSVHQNDIWCARHIHLRVFSFCIFSSYSNLHIVQGYRHSWHVNLVCRKATGKFEVFTSEHHRGQIIEALSQTEAHATVYSAVLSPHCRYVMAVYHVDKHLVCLHKAGALTFRSLMSTIVVVPHH